MNTRLPHFAERLRHLRQARKISLADLANKTAISRSYLCKLERAAANPSLKIMQTLAGALGTTVGDLAADRPSGQVKIPSSLLAARGTLHLSFEEMEDLARIRFRGCQPTDTEEWLLLALVLRLIVCDRRRAAIAVASS